MQGPKKREAPACLLQIELYNHKPAWLLIG